MKTRKKTYILFILTLLSIAYSCVKENEYITPDFILQEPDLNGFSETTFAALVAAYQQAINAGDQLVTFEQDLYITGYVISSDAGSNFYKELIIQNKIDDSSTTADPRLGFSIAINVSGLHQTYQFGRKIYLKLKGLSIGKEHGVLVIGKVDGNSIGQLQEYEYRDHLIRSPEVASISPKTTSIEELKEIDKNTWIQLDHMQFRRNELGNTFAGEVYDQFDGFRMLESCDTQGTLPLQTSTFSDFKSIVVDSNKGSIQGIYSRDYGDDFDVFIINSPSNIVFDDTDRCDPTLLECDGETFSGGTVLFYEDFENSSSTTDLTNNGWANLNIYRGNELFKLRTRSGNSYLQASAYGSGENPCDIWLITPSINLDTTSKEELTFETKTGYDNGRALSVFVSDDFTGDPLTATWYLIEATLSEGPSSGYQSNFTQSGAINLSCLSGNVHIAFRYLGSDSGITTTFQLDNIKVRGE